MQISWSHEKKIGGGVGTPSARPPSNFEDNLTQTPKFPENYLTPTPPPIFFFSWDPGICMMFSYVIKELLHF